MNNTILEKIYNGVLAKVIGVRYGSPVEMWSSEAIKEKYSGVDGYFTEYHDYAADDDLNGPIFFFKALKDSNINNLSSYDIAKAWLNYVPYKHGFYWWGGYGVSEEHTTYLNLKNGIMPPMSGSSLQNTKVLANQIGGQIFSDYWGLVAPNNPTLASHLAEIASKVSHDEEGVCGGKYVASLISIAFDSNQSIKELLVKGLDYIPSSSEYSMMVKDIIRVYEEGMSVDNCFNYIKANYWKDKYGGNCHIIPNAAIMIYSMLYGEGDFIKSLKICNYSGFDTDCNCGNIATILGVYTNLKNVDYNTWIKPINDSIICSSVFGYLNILNIPSIAIDIYNKYLEFEGKEDPALKDLKLDSIDLKFIFNNSTASLKFSDYLKFNNEDSKIVFTNFKNNEYILYKTYYGVNDFTDNRYDPVTSPKAYPGETINIDYETTGLGDVFIFYKDYHTGQIYYSDKYSKELKIEGKQSLINEIGLFISNNIMVIL